MLTTKDPISRSSSSGASNPNQSAVSDAMAEMFMVDLRGDLPKIKTRTLVMGSWIGYKDYTDRAKTEANLKAQYAKLAGVEIRITDTARHFIMWDDPDWMFRADGPVPERFREIERERVAPMKTQNTAYWACQILGWGSYTAIGVAFATHEVGPTFSVLVGSPCSTRTASG